MHWVFIFLVTIEIILADTSEEFKKKCFRPVDLKCCKTLPRTPPNIINNFRDCSRVTQNGTTCDRDKCIAINSGIGTADGKIIMDKATERVENIYKNSEEIINAVKEECIEKDFKRMGQNETCEVKMWRNCIELQLFRTCTQWFEVGPCARIKEHTDDCLKLFQ